MRNYAILLLILTLMSFNFAIQAQVSISCTQTNCVPVGPSSPDIQEKATYSAIDLGFVGNDVSVSVVPNQAAKNVHMSLSNGIIDDAKNVTIDLSSQTGEKNASNFVMIGDNIDALQVKLNGYTGKGGKDASQICAENVMSLKYGADANLKYLQNRSNPSNGLSSDRCGALDVQDLTQDKFSCVDPNFNDVTSTQSVNVDRIRKVSKCMSIIPQPVCVKPAYQITCNYDLWVKNMPNTQGSGENFMNIVPDSAFYNADPNNFLGSSATRDPFPSKYNLDLNNSWKNSILTFKDKLDDGTNGMFYWDIANYLISTTAAEYHDGCSSGGFWTAYNQYNAPYGTFLPSNIFTRSNPDIPNLFYFRQNMGVGNATQINSATFYVTQDELNDINSIEDGAFNFCNARASKFPSSLASKISQVSSKISELENTNLDGSAYMYFFRNNLTAYGGDGCRGRIFVTSKSRGDMTYRARSATVPVVSSQGLDSTGLRLQGAFEKTPKSTNAALTYTNSQGWILDIMKGFSGSNSSSPTCNANSTLLAVESTNLVRYNDAIGSCSGIQSCPSANPDPLGCQIDPDNLGAYNYIGLDPDPQQRLETLACSLTSCPVENKLLEDTRFLDSLVPTAGENGTEQGSGLIFIYDAKTVNLQAQVGQAGAGGKNDLASSNTIRYCAKKRDYTTDPNSNYRNDPSVEFKRINFKAFDVQGGSVPGNVPPFTGKKVNIYKKLDPAVLYLLKKELL